MRDEGQHILRMLRDESERVHRTAAAREEIDRSGVQRLDDPMQVVRMLVGRRLGRGIGLRAPLGPARV